MNINFGRLQFYWRQTENPGIPLNPVADFLPFEFEFNTDLQLIKQRMSQVVKDSLERVYREDFNVGYLDDNNSLAKLYGTDFIDFLNRHVTDQRKLSVLEIGSGKGFLLQHLKEQGHLVTGLDPSPSAQLEGSGINVIPDFFPSDKIEGLWDVLLHYDVLEHAEDAVSFLKAQRDILKDDGRLIFAVPDCTNGIAMGDLSVILHEHINYFDLESVGRTLKAAGFESVETIRSNNVGTIYCVAKKGLAEKQITDSTAKFKKFADKIEWNVSRVRSLIKKYHEDNKTIGFYVPLRFLPYLSQFPELKRDYIRFFDDSSAFKNKFFDGFGTIIEGGDALRERPVDVLLIGSYIFGQKIAQKFSDMPSMKIITVSELFKDNN